MNEGREVASGLPTWSLSPKKDDVPRRRSKNNSKRRELDRDFGSISSGRDQGRESHVVPGEIEEVELDFREIEEYWKRLSILDKTTKSLRKQMESRGTVEPSTGMSQELRQSRLFQSCTQVDLSQLKSMDECQKYLNLFKNKLRKEREEKQRLALQAQELCACLRPLLEAFGREDPEAIPLSEVHNIIADLGTTKKKNRAKRMDSMQSVHPRTSDGLKPNAKPVILPRTGVEQSTERKETSNPFQADPGPRATVKELASALESAIEELQKGTEYLNQCARSPICPSVG